MYSNLAYTLAASIGLTAQLPFSGLPENLTLSPCSVYFSLLSNQKENFPGADGSEDYSDPLPQVVRQRMEEVAGDAVVHHHSREQQHGMIVYTAHFTDSASNVEQIITVAPDGHVLFIEPVLLTFPRSSQIHHRGQKAKMVPVMTEVRWVVPGDQTSNDNLTDRLEVLDAPQNLQGRDAAPASRMGRIEDHR